MTERQSTLGRQLSFAADIKALFRESDGSPCDGAFDVWSSDDVRAPGTAIADRLRDGSMPCDGPWPADRVDLFAQWLANDGPE